MILGCHSTRKDLDLLWIVESNQSHFRLTNLLAHHSKIWQRQLSNQGNEQRNTSRTTDR